MLGEIPRPTGRFADHQAKAIVAGNNPREHDKLREATLREEIQMAITRRQALASAGAVALAGGLAKPAIAAKEPIQVGYLPALTGPSSSTGIGINRGLQFAVKEINDAGGIDGRQVELITRDTQSDPTKAVNAPADTPPGQK